MGGVEEGQKFSVPFPAGSDGYSGAAIPRAPVPVGHWKVGILFRFFIVRLFFCQEELAESNHAYIHIIMMYKHGRMICALASDMESATLCFGMHTVAR